jgi:hypothetical protein
MGSQLACLGRVRVGEVLAPGWKAATLSPVVLAAQCVSGSKAWSL